MGEGTNDCSGKRQRSSRRRAGKPPSDAEITHGKNKEKKRKSKERWPFYEGLTVDELARYRRRRVQGQPKDHFRSHQESITQNPASEYRRAFGTEELSEEDTWPIKDIKKENEDDLQVDAPSSYHMKFKEHEAMENPPATNESASSQLINGNEEIKTTDNTVQVKSFFERPSPKRRGTSLKCDGEFYYDTETFSAYVPYEGHHRPELARRPTFLKMEGDLDTMTEKCEKFIEWLSVSRPTLTRVPTHLKMEGELETETESKNKYVPFVGVRRPELLRRNTNLKLEGNIFFVPEYTDVFRDYRIQSDNDRLQPKEPHLHSTFPQSTVSAKESTRETVEQIKDDETSRYTKDQEEKRKKDEEMQMLVSKLELLNGRPLETPEYRDAYKDFPRERPTIVKPNNEIGRADGSKVFSPPRFKFSAKIDQDPEYQSQHRDYPRDRPIYRKPPSLLRPTGAFSSTRHSACFDSPTYQDYSTIKYEPTCEARSWYTPYDCVPNVESPNRSTDLRLDDNVDYLQPEYKTSYCERYDCRGCDDFKTDYGKCGRSATRKEDELNGNNDSEHDKIAPERNAFCVLDTRIDEENRWKPPLPVGTRFTQATMPPRSTRPKPMDRSLVTARSLSPTYRLHVCDVDNESQGFGRLKQSSERARDPSTDTATQNDAARPYSPSFGKDGQNRRIDHPFVVLDNASSTSKPQRGASCAKRVNRNVNVIPISRERPRTPTKWMPLWYDNTNVI